MTRYFNVLKGLWQDLNLFNDYEWKNPDDCNYNKKMVDNARIFKFLAGLDDEFDEVRGRILGRQPLPPLVKLFSEVRHKDCRRNVMIKKNEGDGTWKLLHYLLPTLLLIVLLALIWLLPMSLYSGLIPTEV